MKLALIYILLLLITGTFLTCKKKTSVKVKVYNYALQEPIANATVVLVQKKGEGGGGMFAAGASCTEIASAITNSNGECSFDKEKLKAGGKFNYFLAITSAYGESQGYPCGGKTSGYLDKGKTQETTLNASYFDGFIQVKYNNLLNPSQPGDTLYVQIVTGVYTVPDAPYPFGGGGVFTASPYYGCNGYPFPATELLPPHKNTKWKANYTYP